MNQVISLQEYTVLTAKIQAHDQARDKIFPGKNSFTQEDLKRLPESPSNQERGWVEVYNFYHTPPQKYFLYVSESNQTVTTFTGGILGTGVVFGKEYRCRGFGGFDSVRVPISFRGINGVRYSGTYYKSAGDYARVRACKT